MRSLQAVMPRFGRGLATIVGGATVGLVVIAVVLAGSQTLIPASTGAESLPPPLNEAMQPLSQATVVPSPSFPDADVTPRSGGLAEAEAVVVARAFLPESDRDEADVWATKSGSFAEVYSLARRPTYVDQPIPEEVAADRMVWAVQFRLPIEICGPPPSECQHRVALRTIFVDFSSGELLRASTFAPAPGEPLPTPN